MACIALPDTPMYLMAIAIATVRVTAIASSARNISYINCKKENASEYTQRHNCMFIATATNIWLCGCAYVRAFEPQFIPTLRRFHRVCAVAILTQGVIHLICTVSASLYWFVYHLPWRTTTALTNCGMRCRTCPTPRCPPSWGWRGVVNCRQWARGT